MSTERHVKLFKNGRNQAVRIPREFELPGEDAVMRKVGDCLILEPAPKTSLRELLASFEQIDEDFPEIADQPPRPFELLTRYLLDTNIMSDIVRYPLGRAASRLLAVADVDVTTSIIVAAELRFGILRKGSSRISAQVEALLRKLVVLPFVAPDDHAYARIRVGLERAGIVIGANDLLIAAQAVARDMTLVTDNEREFARVAGLKWENWLR